MIDLTPIMKALVMLFFIIITYYLVPWLKNKVGVQNMDTFLDWVDIAVAAAEQIYDAADGDQKKAYVISFLEKKGFKVDAEELDNAIEAAVLHLHDQLYNNVEILQEATMTEESEIEEGATAQ